MSDVAIYHNPNQDDPDDTLWACYQCKDKLIEDGTDLIYIRDCSETCELCNRNHIDFEIERDDEQLISKRW